MNIGGSINSGINKLKGIFTRNQKETLNTGDGKRNLYFDYQRRTYIRFQLDVATTCDMIYRIHKDEIINHLKNIYGNNIDLNNFGFTIVELNSNQYDGTPNLINLKLRMDDNIIFRALLNNQLILCYLIITKHNIALKKTVRNSGILNSINEVKTVIHDKKSDKNKDIKVYFPKNVIHFYNYNAYAFSKEKMKITEEDIFITAKPNFQLLIKDIKSITTFLSTNPDDAKKYLTNYKIYGEKPIFCIQIEAKDKKNNLLIGRNSYDTFMLVYRALDAAINNYQNYYSDFNTNNKIIQHNINFISTCNDILREPSSIDDFIINKEKRKIFFKSYNEIEIIGICNNIMEFKKNFNRNKYSNSVNNINNIVNIIDKLEKENKYIDVINAKNVQKINNIWNKIKDICKINFEIDENNNRENENSNSNKNLEVNDNNNDNNTTDSSPENNTFNKEDNLPGNKIDEAKNNNNSNIKLSEDQINNLKEIINIHSFDYLYLEIKEKYLTHYHEQIFNNNNKTNLNEIKSNLKLILGNYFLNNFEMKQENDFVYLGGDEIEKTIEEFNKELNKEKIDNTRVF